MSMSALQSANVKLGLAFAGGVLLAASMFLLWSPTAPPAPEPAAGPPAAVPTAPPEAAPAPPPAPAAKPKPRPAAAKPIQAAALTPAPPELPPPDFPASAAVPSPPAPAAPPPPAPPAVAEAPPPAPEPTTVTISEGTLIPVRLAETIDSNRYHAGDAFRATLAEPLVVNGWVVAERGARVIGRVTDANQAGRVKGLASLTLELESLTTSDGQKVELHTARFTHQARASKTSDAAKVGLGAAIGAIIGAAAGGGKGAAIGAASGGAAGAGTVIATRGNAAVLEAETRISFLLERPVTLTERR
jgi:hypothetical protein